MSYFKAKMHQIPAVGPYSAPPVKYDPLAGFKGSTFKGKETWGRIWGMGGEGMGLTGAM